MGDVSFRRVWPRRQLLCALAIAVAGLLTAPAVPASAELVVPAELQAELLVKLVVYDRNFVERAAGRVRTVLLSRDGDAASKKASGQLKNALERYPEVGRLPHEVTLTRYEGAGPLSKLVRSQGISIVYVPPGFGAEADKIAAALSGSNVLTVAALPEDVERGIVLGFDLVSSKPKLVLNLAQAKRQSVNFKAEVLKLMKVFR